MKTQQECHEALCAGKTLIRNTGTKVKYNEYGCQVSLPEQFIDWTVSDYSFKYPQEWEIDEEPKPSATYDEAVKAKCVRIYWVGMVEEQHGPQEYERCPDTNTWYKGTLKDFAFAADKGYRMEVVE